MATCETIEDVLKKETNDIQKTNESLTIIDVHRQPLTKILAQSIHAWQEEWKRVRREEENFNTENVKDQCLVLRISWAMATEIK